MPLPEGTKLRAGDVVMLHAAVKHDFDPANSDHGYVHLDVPGATICLTRPSDIAGVVRRAFSPGEKVKLTSSDRIYTVEAVSFDENALWLRGDDGDYLTAYTDEAELVEDRGAAR